MQVFNTEVLNEHANPSHQGTQIDALGHFGYLDEAWDGTSPLSTDTVRYYGGFSQRDVKPTPDSPLLKLGMDKCPPSSRPPSCSTRRRTSARASA
jgi:hypothetical protein